MNRWHHLVLILAQAGAIESYCGMCDVDYKTDADVERLNKGLELGFLGEEWEEAHERAQDRAAVANGCEPPNR